MKPANLPLRRWTFFAGVAVTGMALAALLVLASPPLPVWLVAALSILIGVLATMAMDEWDDRHAPNFVAVWEGALKDEPAED